MRNICTSTLHHLLFVLLLFALTGCGASNSNIAGTGDTAGKGSVTAKLQWGAGTEAGKTTAKTVASVPAGVVKIRLTVSGANVPVVRNDIAVVGGTITQGQISGIYPGSISLVIQALDANDTALYEGFALNVVVAAGKTTDVGTLTMTVPTVKAADTPCLGCHETYLDTNGQNLVAGFKQSGHYTNMSFKDANGAGAGCAGCHGPSHNTPNPFASGRCFECHTPAQAQHSNTQTGTGARPAEYLATNYQGKCDACHSAFQHDTTGNVLDERHAWAKSGHGDVNGVAWSAEDFQAPGQAACQRCHTATGFKSFVANNYAAQTTTLFSATDTNREVLACDACHTDNSFNVRTAPAFTTPYTANGPINQSNMIPDVGESNLCIPCHTGRAAQADILAVADFTNASFKNPHYLPAAGIMYMKIGFINFTSMTALVPGSTTATYGLNYSLPLPVAGKVVKGSVDAAYGGVVSGVGSAHRGLGTPSIRGGETWQTAPTYGLWESKGPCVTCHVNADLTGMPTFAGYSTLFYNSAKYGAIPKIRAAGGHSLSATSPDAAKQVCIPCHNDAGGLSDPAVAAEEKLAEAKPYFDAGVAIMAKLFALAPINIKFDNAAYPYFYDLAKDPTGQTAVTDWTRGTKNQAYGKKLMGAAHNLKLLSTDSAAYVHGRTYSQRLIFDTIDFLDDGIMNRSSAATIVKLGDPVLFPSVAADHWLFKANGVRK